MRPLSNTLPATRSRRSARASGGGRWGVTSLAAFVAAPLKRREEPSKPARISVTREQAGKTWFDKPTLKLSWGKPNGQFHKEEAESPESLLILLTPVRHRSTWTFILFCPSLSKLHSLQKPSGQRQSPPPVAEHGAGFCIPSLTAFFRCDRPVAQYLYGHVEKREPGHGEAERVIPKVQGAIAR